MIDKTYKRELHWDFETNAPKQTIIEKTTLKEGVGKHNKRGKKNVKSERSNLKKYNR